MTAFGDNTLAGSLVDGAAPVDGDILRFDGTIGSWRPGAATLTGAGVPGALVAPVGTLYFDTTPVAGPATILSKLYVCTATPAWVAFGA